VAKAGATEIGTREIRTAFPNSRSQMGGATLDSMIPEISYNPNAQPRDCPKCGQLLLNHGARTEMDGQGNPETVDMFLCYTHGFFTFRESKWT
jgi:hypothetical protein